MEDFYLRTQSLIGEEGIEKLKSAKVLVCGLGGVGGYAVEALARAGIGTLGLLDCDVVVESNLNRQIIATRESIGGKKTEAARERVKAINPKCIVKEYFVRYSETTANEVNLEEYDYVIDAVDTVSAKVELICRAKCSNVKIISSMGTGNKLSTDFVISDISKTSVCPLARVVRKLLRDKGVARVPVLYSKEQPRKSAQGRVPASISYVPAVAGLQLAGWVIRDRLGEMG